MGIRLSLVKHTIHRTGKTLFAFEQMPRPEARLGICFKKAPIFPKTQIMKIYRRFLAASPLYLKKSILKGLVICGSVACEFQ
jgi:hypothetical protein